MEKVISCTSKVEILTLQTTNDWGSMAIENKTKITLYDELIKQLPIEMGELLEKARVKFKNGIWSKLGSTM
jgi:hypothetical protein